MLDVLSVGVVLGDAGTLYDSSFRCFYQGENTLETERKQQKDPEIQQGCVCTFVFMRLL